jgi:hypothetical protein
LFSFILDIATFNLIPMDTIYGHMFSFRNSTAYKPNFDEGGYGSLNIISNLGTIVAGIPLIALSIIFYFFLNWLNLNVKFIKSIEKYLADSLFYNTILRFLIEGYTQFTICSILNL